MAATALDTSHLDLGCGECPRNPYGHTTLYGIDIVDIRAPDEFVYRRANLALEPIPFEDDFFDSISAFDFLEHIPRQALSLDGKTIRLPFIELMSEIWRTLKPSGLFYALTPAYPAPQAFQDPTHVNIITDATHDYFCGDPPLARRYGFNGRFEVVRVRWTCPKNAYSIQNSLRKSIRNFHRKYFRRGLSHLLWELRAVK